MRELLRDYLKIDRAVLLVIIAEFILQFINASFLAIQPLYMQHEGFSDGQSAGFISFRFLGILLFAIPLGIYIKGRKIKNLFYVCSIGVPGFALLIIEAIHTHNHLLLYTSQFLWGTCFTFMQTPILPFILRNSKKESHTGGISLSYATWSFASIASSLLIAVLSFSNPHFFTEQNILILISIMGFSSIYFIYKARLTEAVSTTTENPHNSTYDWSIIVKALFPTTIIAVGAGLTIPFISLFFVNVHHMSTGGFSILNMTASILIAFGALLVPAIKKNIGYQIAVPTTQSLAVFALVAMATTQYYNELPMAFYIAIVFFLLRQPLMNLAGPMTSEVVMNYVGKKNQEMVSALTSAIWSGSWFISSRIFKILRDSGEAYVNIFLITAALYAFGVAWYYFLVVDYNRRIRSGELED